MHSVQWSVLALALLAGSLAAHGQQAYGGAPPLGPADALRRTFAPYDLFELHSLGANYCENLLDMRVNVPAYTHLAFDTNSGDAYNLHFPDDCARLIEGLAWEDQFSPVVRLELARRLMKGMLAAQVPGTRGESFFRHRSGGKTYMVFEDKTRPEGRLMLSTWGDEISGLVRVGFRVRRGGEWHEMAETTRTDEPAGGFEPGTARMAGGGRYWNESPYTARRTYAHPQGWSASLTARTWLSDEDKPIEFAVKAPGAEGVQTVLGDREWPMEILGNYRIPASLHMPDRETVYRSDRDGDRVFEAPAFNHFILRRPSSWATEGFSSALLVMWEGTAERVECTATMGFREVRFTWPAGGGRVWLYPYYWLDDADIEAIHRSAEQFLATGSLLQKGYPSQQMVNAIPAGLAAGAYLLARHRDPMAHTAWVNAARTVDRLFEAEDEGKKVVRCFFPVRAAAWMVKAAKERGDTAAAERYAALLDRAVARMTGPLLGYDGRGWAGGWDHFNCAKSSWLAYDATGRDDYRQVWERALTVYTIDEKGIYRYGKALTAPGGFDTYAGSMPMGVWGLAGRMDMVDTLINLDVPNGWHQPQVPVKDLWNDAGAGPWAQDDANPEYVGLCLGGAGLPLSPRVSVPVGAFAAIDRAGAVTVTRAPLLRNPFFLPGEGRVRRLEGPVAARARKVRRTEAVPGTAAERRLLKRAAGAVRGAARVVTGADGALVYRFGVRGARGAAVDLRLAGSGYQVEVSPDGQRWYPRLDTWDETVRDQSLDVSFLTGSREELLRLDTTAPPGDARLLVDAGGSSVEREHYRYVADGRPLVYSLELPAVTECHLELLVGNGYRVECSHDGKEWRPGIDAMDVDGGSGKATGDAGWLRMLDVSAYARQSGRVYVRVSDLGRRDLFGGRPAFLRRLAAYGAVRSGEVWVRVSNVSTRADRAFTLEGLALRSW